MLITSFRRKTLLLFLLATVLAAPALSAATAQPESPLLVQYTQYIEFGPLEILGRILKFLRQGGEGKEGCRIDPNGCIPQNSLPLTKEGCRIDPDGRCLP